MRGSSSGSASLVRKRLAAGTIQSWHTKHGQADEPVVGQLPHEERALPRDMGRYPQSMQGMGRDSRHHRHGQTAELRGARTRQSHTGRDVEIYIPKNSFKIP